MSKPWFRPKRFGYGATPDTWEGWAATTVFAVIITGVTVAIRTRLHGATGLVVSLIVIAIVTFGFGWFVRKKSSGPWKWR